MRARLALVLLAFLACEREAPPRYPQSTPPGQPPPRPGYQQQPPGYGQPAQPPTLLGSAVTALGVLLGQVPPLPQGQPLPPLPPIHDWSTLPWVFPWPAPQPPPPGPGPAPLPGAYPPQRAAWEDEVLALTNQRRAGGAVCGSQSFGPAGPLAAHPALRNAARGHSRDMGVRGYFDHTSPDGRGPADRAVAAGYSSTFVGENIGAGYRGPGEVVQGWMESPGHCVNIMDPRYRVLGVGYHHEPSSQMGHYWTQNFGG